MVPGLLQIHDQEVIAALGAARRSADERARRGKTATDRRLPPVGASTRTTLMSGHGKQRPPRRKQRVLIAGGGLAGVEAALALRDLAADWVEVSLRDPRREFAFRPFAVGEPYGAARIFRCDLEQIAGVVAPRFTPTGSSRSTPGAGSRSPVRRAACLTTSSWRAGRDALGRTRRRHLLGRGGRRSGR